MHILKMQVAVAEEMKQLLRERRLSEPFDVNKWPLDSGNGPVLLVKKLKSFMPDEQIAEVLQAIDTTCGHCWDKEWPCRCRAIKSERECDE